MRQITVLLLICCSVSAAFAQQATTATLSGRVTDPKGAVITNVKVIATQIATGAQRETVTNSEGLYALTNLPPGEYEMIFEKGGFKKHIFRSLIVQVGQSVARWK
jgi:hypothetical protein